LVLGNGASVGIGTATPAYTLDVQGNGRFTLPVVFASNQTYPNMITAVNAGTGLAGGGTRGSVTLSLDTTQFVTGVVAGTGLTGGGTGGYVTLSLDSTQVPQLNAGNTFTGNQTVNGSLSATGGFLIGSNPFAFGYYSYGNAYLGFAGNTKTTGYYNTGIGQWALTSDTAGTGNTASGYDALYNNTAGNYNTASGESALIGNTTGIGNTASGAEALYSNMTGYENTAIGMDALYTNLTGDHNTALGGGALNGTFTGGSYNTCVGFACSVSNGLSNATSIGALAPVGENNAIVLGSIKGVNGASSNVNVGIGTSTPQYTLDVVGNVHISGSLSKGSGSFQIDHPLDPANKYLYHSFVESPDMMNVYNGNIVTDEAGLATVSLPDWFEALNRDFRYQLTVIGQFAQAMVASEISHNQFTIRTDKPNVKVSWQATGIRQDAYANAHRIPVEEDKPPQEQKHYLHPELFGAGPEQAVGYHAPAVQR
jgi:hypothetical protein